VDARPVLSCKLGHLRMAYSILDRTSTSSNGPDDVKGKRSISSLLIIWRCGSWWSAPWLRLWRWHVRVERGMYMPNASWRSGGSKAQGEGSPHPGSEAERTERSGGLHKRHRGPRRVFLARWGGGARKIGETPCAARSGQSPLARFGFLMRAHQRTGIKRVGVAGRNGPLRRVAEDALAAEGREEASSRTRDRLI